MASPAPTDSTGSKSSHAGEKKPTAAAAPGRVDGEDEAPAARAGMTRLPRLEVVQILSRNPCSIKPYNMDALRALVHEVRPGAPEDAISFVAETFNKGMRKKFVGLQSWVRGEFDGKEAQKRQGGQVDLFLSDRYFTTTVSGREYDGDEELVFSFAEMEKAVSECKSEEDEMFLSYKCKSHHELKSAAESSEDEEDESSDGDGEGDESDEDD